MLKTSSRYECGMHPVLIRRPMVKERELAEKKDNCVIYVRDALCSESADQRIGMSSPSFPRFPDSISIDYGKVGVSLFSVAVISETYQKPRSVTV